MITVWKSLLFVTGERQMVSLPMGAVIVSVQPQHGRICIWAEVNTDSPSSRRYFRVYGTGHPIDEAGKHVGTVQMDDYVWHVYEV